MPQQLIYSGRRTSLNYITYALLLFSMYWWCKNLHVHKNQHGAGGSRRRQKWLKCKFVLSKKSNLCALEISIKRRLCFKTNSFIMPAGKNARRQNEKQRQVIKKHNDMLKIWLNYSLCSKPCRGENLIVYLLMRNESFVHTQRRSRQG